MPPRKGKAGKRGGGQEGRGEAGPENPQGCDRGRATDALSTTYLPTVEPARPVSRPPRYTKEIPAALPLPQRQRETPSELARGPPASSRAIISPSNPPANRHVRQWRSSGPKNLAFRTNRHPFGDRVFLHFLRTSLRTLEDLLDVLEKSRARAAASFRRVPNFIVAPKPAERDEQLPVGRVFRAFFARCAFLRIFFPHSAVWKPSPFSVRARIRPSVCPWRA